MNNILELLKIACDTHTLVRISYKTKAKRKAKVRDIEVYRFGKWYVEAYCCLRKDHRRFRIDRIVEAELLDETFTPRPFIVELVQRYGWEPTRS